MARLIDLGTLGGSRSIGLGINDLGQVTGGLVFETPVGSHAFLYSDGQMFDLGTFGGGGFSVGVGINNLGQVTGPADIVSGASHAFSTATAR